MSLASTANVMHDVQDVDDVKAEPPATPRLGAEDEDEEVNVKDWKPDVDVSYKGELQNSP